jgi:hypothetical protein
MLKKSAFFSYAATLAALLVGGAFATSAFADTAAAYTPAYPASCLADGVPLGKSSLDPNAITSPLTLQSYDTTTGGYPSESDSVSVWRVPCSGGGAATIVEVDRNATYNGNTTQYAVFPNIYLTTAASTTTEISPRLVPEPNTLFEYVESNSILYNSTAYVLEYYEPTSPASPATKATGPSVIDYNQAFTLNINNLTTGGQPLVISVPAYTPPSTAALMPISGYLSTNWSNPAQSGEGMVVQVYDNGDQATRTLSFAWFTYGDQNQPFWLYGQAAFDIGATTVTAQTIYLAGGTFAYNGNVVFPVPQTPWGTVTFTFPDCGHMNIAYSGDASAVHGPKGNSTAQFTRVADVANLGCK